jgi:hypothetical protein
LFYFLAVPKSLIPLSLGHRGISKMTPFKLVQSAPQNGKVLCRQPKNNSSKS